MQFCCEAPEMFLRTTTLQPDLLLAMTELSFWVYLSFKNKITQKMCPETVTLYIKVLDNNCSCDDEQFFSLWMNRRIIFLINRLVVETFTK